MNVKASSRSSTESDGCAGHIDVIVNDGAQSVSRFHADVKDKPVKESAVMGWRNRVAAPALTFGTSTLKRWLRSTDSN